MMKVIKGDIISLAKEGNFDVIVHGCNCFCTMGRGIARDIRINFPNAAKSDKLTQKGDKTKLGSFSFSAEFINGHNLVVINAYTQYHWDGIGILANYAAIEKVFKEIKSRYSGSRIAYPKIGAGLARGDWNIISWIIETELKNEDHTCVEYEKPKVFIFKNP
jgi:O-acetyl-ADP-ribose deacetylase (regulator of RNase III)